MRALSGFVAMGAIVIGGAKYLTSVGNPSAIEDAKRTIYAALSGLLLAITSWVIIGTINPDVLVVKKPDMPGTAVWYSESEKTQSCAYAIGNEKLEDAGCNCIDGAKGVYKIPTTVTLESPSDNETTTLGNVTFLKGTLKDTNTGDNLTEETVTVYAIYSSKMRSILRDSISLGYYNNSAVIGCSAEVQLVAYYAGNETYAPSASTIIKHTNEGSSDCTESDFDRPLINFAEASNCNAICAIPSDFHCLKPVFKVGKIQEEALSGYSSEITVDVGDSVFFNADPAKMLTAFPIGEIDISYDSVWSDWWTNNVTYQYKCSLNGGCSSHPKSENPTNCDPISIGDKKWKEPYHETEGMFAHAYTDSDDYPIIVNNLCFLTN